jgi:fatty acid desaturase
MGRKWAVREWPTWLVLFGSYAGWLGLTLAANAVPAVWLPMLGGALLALHGSLQHEAIHGHPTRSPRRNAWLAGAPLSLWLPYAIYRDSHLAHHRSTLTDPASDPESFYVDAQHWSHLGGVRRALLWVTQTLVGRMVLGPPLIVGRTLIGELRILGCPLRRRVWGWHAVAVAAVLVWVMVVCDLSLTAYVLNFVYPGLALTLLRSFVEHRSGSAKLEHNTAIVEAGAVLSLLFLNNNLHVVHHARPGLPWYALPAHLGRHADRARQLGTWYRGYGHVAWRFALRPKDHPVFSMRR